VPLIDMSRVTSYVLLSRGSEVVDCQVARSRVLICRLHLRELTVALRRYSTISLVFVWLLGCEESHIYSWSYGDELGHLFQG